MMAMVDIESWSAWRVQPRLAEVSAKVLAIFGGRDPRANIDTARHELAKVSDSRFVVFENARHYPQIDETDRFDDEVLKFLRASFP
jgi:pimeloyl-ACP methyl ester carboxylesterase